MKKKKKAHKVLIFHLGLGLILAFGFLLTVEIKLNFGKVKTTAIVTEIYDIDENSGQKGVRINFFANGELYEYQKNLEAEDLIDDINVGDEIAIYYDPDMPNYIRVSSYRWGWIALYSALILSGVFFIVIAFRK